jgi:hypothetical protein
MSRRILPFFALMTLTLALAACASTAGTPPSEPPARQETPSPPPYSPEPAPEPAENSPVPSVEPESDEEIPPQADFDPFAVSVEVKTAAIADIRTFIENLNGIIQRQDYGAWLSHLTPEYVIFYSDPVLLALYSEYPVLQRQNIHLRTLKDYFLYLVYPSRQNDRVDDIEYVSENLVKAITVSPQGSRDILYILEKHGDTWHIGIGR